MHIIAISAGVVRKFITNCLLPNAIPIAPTKNDGNRMRMIESSISNISLLIWAVIRQMILLTCLITVAAAVTAVMALILSDSAIVLVLK